MKKIASTAALAKRVAKAANLFSILPGAAIGGLGGMLYGRRSYTDPKDKIKYQLAGGLGGALAGGLAGAIMARRFSKSPEVMAMMKKMVGAESERQATIAALKDKFGSKVPGTNVTFSDVFHEITATPALAKSVRDKKPFDYDKYSKLLSQYQADFINKLNPASQSLEKIITGNETALAKKIALISGKTIPFSGAASLGTIALMQKGKKKRLKKHLEGNKNGKSGRGSR